MSPEKNRGQSDDFVMPVSVSLLIKALDKRIPSHVPDVHDLCTEAGRISYAKHLGKRELIDWLKIMERKS